MMMTTQGGIRLDHALDMSDGERLRWVQRCIDYNEEMERKHGGGPSKTVDKGFDF